jgi:AraC-like DNA-binding protein
MHQAAPSGPIPATLLIGVDRMLYSGPLRRSLAPRLLGALSIYVAPRAFEIAIGDGPRRNSQFAVVPPQCGHWITPPQGPIWNLLIEPESTTQRTLAGLAETCPEALLDRLASASQRLGAGDGFTTQSFDELTLGRILPARRLDLRCAAVIAALNADPTLSADDCGRAVDLSASRFLHLFKQETGIPFRAFRMWKRARRFLDQATSEASLTEIAMSLGYPDSSHFSHSIRRTFGMGPSLLRAGAKGLRVRLGQGYAQTAV